MNFAVEKLENEPILLVTIKEGYRVRDHQALSDLEAIAILDATTVPVYHVVDVTNFKLNFDDVIAAANTGARGADPAWHHPNNRMLIFVSPNPIVKTAVAGLSSKAFGNLNAKAFNTLDNALTWIRSQS